MNEIYELAATPRQTHGTAHSRRMRRKEEMIPAIIYGAEKPSTSITLSHHLVKRALANEAFFSHILTIDLEGNKEQVVVKDIQRHPYKPKILHMDFLRVKANEKLKRSVPLHFVNEEKAPGVKDGGIVAHQMSELHISCLPSHLPEYIEVDLGHLALGSAVHLADLKLPQGVSLAGTPDESHNPVVAAIHEPHVEEEPEITVAPAEEAAGEAATEVKPEEAGNTEEIKDKE